MREIVAFGIVLSSCCVFSEGREQIRIVARDDFTVSRQWELPTFLGTDFHTVLRWWKGSWVDESLSGDAPLPVYRSCGRVFGGKRTMKEPSSHSLVVDMNAKEPTSTPSCIRKTPGEMRQMTSYGLVDMLGGDALSAMAKDRRRPIILDLPGQRPPFYLDAEYPLADSRGFAKWRAEHTNYLGHYSANEFGTDSLHYPLKFASCPEGETIVALERAFPATYYDGLRTPHLRGSWVPELVRRCNAYNFSDDRMMTFLSWYPGFVVHFARAGVKLIGYEASGSPRGAFWSMSAAYVRGAARMFSIPWCWYTASCATLCKRDGSPGRGELSLDMPAKMPKNWGDWFGADRGLSFSLMARQNLYGWLAGALYVEEENWQHHHCRRHADGRLEPSQAARDFNRLFEMSRRIDRGVPYTPLALMLPIDEHLSVEGLPSRYSDVARTAAVATLVPARSERQKGNEGSFYNSDIGDVWDIVCPDALPDSKSRRALSPYKAAVLLGLYRGLSPQKAIEDYVCLDGGTVVISCDQVRAGLVSEKIAGVSFDAREVHAAGRRLIDDCGVAHSLDAPYVLEKGVPTTAHVLWTDEKCTPIAYLNRMGKGAILTLAVPGMVPYGLDAACNLTDERAAVPVFRKVAWGGTPCRLLKVVFKRLQSESLPVEIKGDVQFGVNRTKKGWLVWLFNNKGVEKFHGEPERVDLTCSSQVQVALKQGGRWKASDADTGERLCVTDGAVRVSVGPGGWRLVALSNAD